jgi:hypothetical protein
MLSLLMLNVIILSVTNKKLFWMYFILSVTNKTIMKSVVMLNVIMLNVVAPFQSSLSISQNFFHPLTLGQNRLERLSTTIF